MSHERKKYSDKPIQRAWRPSELKLIWDFAQHDFVRFLAMLVWLDGLE